MKKVSVTWIALLILLAVAGSAFAQDSTPLSTIPGRIAYVGNDYNVYILNGDNSRLQLTDDAGPIQDTIQIYQWPTWSTDGRLAYFRSAIDPGGQIHSTDVFVSPDGTNGNKIYSGAGEVFNYAYWAPQDCAGVADCRDLAVLLNNQQGLFVQMIRDSSGAVTSQVAGTGAPFYYSWSPDATRMLWQRDNTRVDVYSVESNSVVNSLPMVPGMFLSPAWSPVDDRLLFGALDADQSTTDLVISANGQTNTLASKLEGRISFAWSPDGNSVAYSVGSGPLLVVDAVTGQSVTRSPGGGVLAFFWSPDSRLIAYITLSTPPGSFSAFGDSGGIQAAQQAAPTGLAWTVLDVSTGATRRYSSFVPTRDMVYLLSFFDQFAQSHRVWSPDSRHILYSEVRPDRQQVLTLIDVTQENTVPLSVAEGHIGVWSFE